MCMAAVYDKTNNAKPYTYLNQKNADNYNNRKAKKLEQSERRRL